MDDGTPQGENGNPTNNAGTGDESERLRKKAEQAEMRANQLANELAAERKAKEEAAEAKLKENEEFKTLYEQEREKRSELEKAEAEAKAQAKAKTAMDEINKDYSNEVLELADAAGIKLTDSSEEATNSYRGRLTAISQKIAATSSPVRGNNPAPRVDTTPEKTQLMEGLKRGNKGARSTYISGLNAVKQMRQMAGVEPPQQ